MTNNRLTSCYCCIDGYLFSLSLFFLFVSYRSATLLLCIYTGLLLLLPIWGRQLYVAYWWAHIIDEEMMRPCSQAPSLRAAARSLRLMCHVGRTPENPPPPFLHQSIYLLAFCSQPRASRRLVLLERERDERWLLLACLMAVILFLLAPLASLVVFVVVLPTDCDGGCRWLAVTATAEWEINKRQARKEKKNKGAMKKSDVHTLRRVSSLMSVDNSPRLRSLPPLGLSTATQLGRPTQIKPDLRNIFPADSLAPLFCLLGDNVGVPTTPLQTCWPSLKGWDFPD